MPANNKNMRRGVPSKKNGSTNSKKPKGIPFSDTTQVNGVWFVKKKGGKLARVSMLHEGFPGGEEVYQRLRHASSRIAAISRAPKKSNELTDRDWLGIETEKSHFRFAKIIGESRALKDKGLHDQASANLVHAREILDSVNEQRKRFGLGSLTGKQLLLYQRPLTTVEVAEQLYAAVRRTKKRRVQRQLLRTLRGPEEKILQQLHARVEQLENDEAKLSKHQRGEILQLLKKPAREILHVMRARIRQLEQLKKTTREQAIVTTVRQTDETRIVTPAERFASKPKWMQKDLLTLLTIAQNAIEIERKMNQRGDKDHAKKAIETYDQAMRVFTQLFGNNE